jgi:hypothetical protein
MRTVHVSKLGCKGQQFSSFVHEYGPPLAAAACCVLLNK